MDDEPDRPAENIDKSRSVSRQPTVEDFVKLCRALNAQSACYVIVGGFAMRAAGYLRDTFVVDVLIETTLENQAKVHVALESLPDRAVRQLDAGDMATYSVVRVADEVVADLMKGASAIEYEEASKDVVFHLAEGVEIPFASPRLLWRMKKNTHRAKDAADLAFLRRYYSDIVG